MENTQHHPTPPNTTQPTPTPQSPSCLSASWLAQPSRRPGPNSVFCLVLDVLEGDRARAVACEGPRAGSASVGKDRLKFTGLETDSEARGSRLPGMLLLGENRGFLRWGWEGMRWHTRVHTLAHACTHACTRACTRACALGFVAWKPSRCRQAPCDRVCDCVRDYVCDCVCNCVCDCVCVDGGCVPRTKLTQTTATKEMKSNQTKMNR